jgi:ABC-type multidrug transport system fused ATPase/permease subunit
MLLLAIVLAQALAIACGAWLSAWAGETHASQLTRETRGKYLPVYIAMVCATLALGFARSVWFFHVSVLASDRLHARMVRAAARAPMLFFESQPTGRILNRFSKDVNFMDDLLPYTLFDAASICVQVLGSIALACVVVPWVLLVAAPLAFAFRWVRNYYLMTGRDVKRLEAVSRSPVFTAFSESLDGLVTIRSYRKTRDFERRFIDCQDANSRAYYIYLASHRWMSIRLDALAVVLVAGTGYGAMCMKALSDVDSGLIGLALSFMLQIGPLFAWMVRQSGEVENIMVSVERVLDYCNVAPEAFLRGGETGGTGGTGETDETGTGNNSSSIAAVPSLWPREGCIQFENVCCRHRANLPLTLKGITCTIPGGSNVGIVGRTGAGKTTLVAALFRLIELDKRGSNPYSYSHSHSQSGGGGDGVGGGGVPSRIVIDGVDVSSIGLHDLRTNLSVIAQTPVLFSGTVRENLDPFSEYSDDAIWSALGEVAMRETIAGLYDSDGLSSNSGKGNNNGSSNSRLGLGSIITESGSNFSVGQRQLLCLARAILPRNRILLLDEATANVDIETDAMIQRAVRRKFATSTVLMIAHRLDTIIDCDKIMVMDNGHLVEYDSPHALLSASPTGAFAALVEQTGEDSQHRLRAQAQEASSAAHEAGI